MIALALPLAAGAEDYFTPGTVWEMMTGSTSNPANQKIKQTVEVRDVGEGVTALYSMLEGDMDWSFVAYVVQEGDEVYFKKDNTDSARRYLMYDFGLMPGHGCYVYDPVWTDSKTQEPHRYYVRCVGTSDKDPYYDEWNVMRMEEFEDETCTMSFGEFVWIKGLASELGVLNNAGMDLDGGGSYLYSVFRDGEMVYEDVLRVDGYFTDGTCWETLVTDTTTPDQPTSVQNVRIIRNSTYTYPAMYLCDEQGEVTALVGQIRQTRDKVYFNPTLTISRWYLMYDFGLEEGEGCYVYSPLRKTSAGVPQPTYVRCTGITERNEDYDGWDTMRLEEYKDDTCQQYYGEGIWIKGLSSASGVLFNGGFELDGVGSVLNTVTSEGVEIYRRPSGVTDIQGDAEDAPVRYYNLQGIEIPVPERGQTIIRKQGGVTTKFIAR